MSRVELVEYSRAGTLPPQRGFFFLSDRLPFRLLDRRLVDMASDEIQVGQRVQQNGAVWEVMEIKPANGLLHVQISKVGDPTELKLISLSSLLGGYDLLPE